MNKLIPIMIIVVAVIIAVGLGANMMLEHQNEREMDLSQSSKAQEDFDMLLELCKQDLVDSLESGITVNNQTHWIDLKSCTLTTYISDILKEIFANCNCQEDPERTCEHTFIDWQNSTHYIDNNLCEFIPLK